MISLTYLPLTHARYVLLWHKSVLIMINVFNFVDNEIMLVINEFWYPVSINHIFNHMIYLHLRVKLLQKISIDYRKIISIFFLPKTLPMKIIYSQLLGLEGHHSNMVVVFDGFLGGLCWWPLLVCLVGGPLRLRLYTRCFCIFPFFSK
jgi:hypothetical protein